MSKILDIRPEYLPLFVYGTLMEGFANFNHFLKETKPEVRPAALRDHVLLARSPTSHFPYMANARAVEDATYDTEGDFGFEVKGQLIFVPKELFEQTLARLDALEGYPNHYNRKIVEVEEVTDTSDFTACVCRTVRAWTYFLDDKYVKEFFYDPIIHSGSWDQFTKAREQARVRT